MERNCGRVEWGETDSLPILSIDFNSTVCTDTVGPGWEVPWRKEQFKKSRGKIEDLDKEERWCTGDLCEKME